MQRLSEDGRYWIVADPVTGIERRIRRVSGGAEMNTPVPPEWEAYLTQTPGKLEVIPDQLWDTQTYDDNVTTRLDFFQNVAANQSLSNMTQPGFLPNPQAFLVECIRLYYRITYATVDQGGAAALASALNDIVLIQNTGRATLTIGNKQYGPWRLWTMPANAGLVINNAAAGGEAANLVSQYGFTSGREWALFPALMMSPMQNFHLTMEWPAAIDTSADLVIEVLFDGKRSRAVQ